MVLRCCVVAIGFLSAVMAAGAPQGDTQPPPWDLVVYGGTAAGVVAAVQASGMGCRVVIVAPASFLGGLSAAGLGATDTGNKNAIGGLSREFYRRIKQCYAAPEAWRQEKREDYPHLKDSADALWRFEPHVARAVFEAWVREADIEVIFGERLDRRDGVEITEHRIAAITMESGRRFRGGMFIDATYEGDLMAAAGVPFTVGREAAATYGERLNGVQIVNAVHHQFKVPVDPYLVPGDPASGLLPGVHDGSPGVQGAGDHRVQAYNFRLCLTDDPRNRVPFTQPEGYDPRRYELLLRNFEAGDHMIPWNSVRMPNRKTDTNNNGAFSTDHIGANYAWPEADYRTRKAMFADHRSYQRGLLWTLAHHPRVPEAVRREVQRWGLARDEFLDSEHWPPQIYVREGRRMIADYVMTEADCLGKRRCEDPAGLGAYNMDSHNTQRYVDAEGHVRNEGDVQVPPTSPYPIAWRSLIPGRGSVENLAVPVCVSASHIAYGSIRMEPVFMVLGQAAATGAVFALRAGCPVQEVDYRKLAAQLTADRQILKWKPAPPKVTGIPLDRIPGIVVDDAAATLEGAWTPSTSGKPYVGFGYRHDGNSERGRKSARFEIPLPAAGRYELRMAWCASGNRSRRTRVTIAAHGLAATVRTIDQRQRAPIDGLWISLGTFSLDRRVTITVENTGADGHVIIDAVQALPAP